MLKYKVIKFINYCIQSVYSSFIIFKITYLEQVLDAFINFLTRFPRTFFQAAFGNGLHGLKLKNEKCLYPCQVIILLKLK